MKTSMPIEKYKGNSISFIEKIIGNKKVVKAEVDGTDISALGSSKEDTLSKIKKMINVEKNVDASTLIKKKSKLN